MIKRAYAKINLLLSVVGLDPSSNYHFLQMVSQKINLHDIVKIKISNENRLIFHNEPLLNSNTDNQVLACCISFCKKYNISNNHQIDIYKRIPVGAGLGGESADISAVLQILVEMYNIDSNTSDFKSFVSSFGSDVPFMFYISSGAIVEGFGELLTKVLLPIQPIAIIYPNQGLSTKEVFESATVLNTRISHEELLSKIKAKEYKNDLMTICIKKLPTIESNIIKASNYGIACMTGSGSSIVLYDYKKKFELIHEMKKNNKIIFTQTR